MLTLHELVRAVAGQASVDETGEAIATHLRRLIPFAQSVLFLYDISTDELVARRASGGLNGVVIGLRIPLGQRLSGWVGANRKTILNSDPVLDLGEATRNNEGRLRSCLSTPLVCGDRLIGVLTLYSPVVDGFTDRDQRIIEAAARQIGLTLNCTTREEHSARRDPLTGLPRLEYLEQLVKITGCGRLTDLPMTLLYVNVVCLETVNTEHGPAAGDAVLVHVVKQVNACLRASEVLFRHSGDEFVILLDRSNIVAAEALASRIREYVSGGSCAIQGGRSILVEIDVSVATATHDGMSLPDLVTIAKLRLSARAAKNALPSVH
jgi:diguanylate cyclase (GGDEF)-like protein